MKSNELVIFSAVSAASSQNSAPIPLEQVFGYSAQYVFSSATVTGSIKLQASCDAYNPQLPIASQLPTNWTDIADSSFTLTAGGNGLWNVEGAFYSWVRIVFTRTAGTGTLSARMRVKG